MALSAKALREKRGPIGQEIKRLADQANDENRDFTAEEAEKWDTINKEYNQLSRSIELAETAERIEADQAASNDADERAKSQAGKALPGRGDVDHRGNGEPIEHAEERVTPNDDDKDHALRAWCVRQADGGAVLSERQLDALKRCRINPNSRDYHLGLTNHYHKVRDAFRARNEGRALSGNILTSGGATIVDGFISNLELAMLAFGGMRQVSEVIRTDKGEDLHWPTSNDTSNTGAILPENGAVSEQDVTFGEMVLHAYLYSSKMVKVPFTLLQDSAFDLASFLGSALGERLGRIQNTHFTTGNGAAQPKGIVTAAATGVTAASATAVTADELLGLVHSIDPAYRMGGGVGWMMHDSILLVIRKLKDGNGQYLWMPGLSNGEPDRLCGFPVTINQDMASALASGSKAILFGLLSKYKIRDVGDVRIRRLDERYADNDQVAFVALSRHDGGLLDAGSNPVKVLVN